MLISISPLQKQVHAASLITTLAVTLAIASPGWAQNRAYLRSNVQQPFNQISNDTSMNTVFGAGNWADLRYETANVATLFSNATAFIFMEGGGATASEMETFLDANRPAMEAWVSNGGALFANAAPTEGDGMDIGFGVSLSYPFYSDNVSAVNALHPIFAGPFGATGTNFTGSDFAHGRLLGGSLSGLLTNNDSGEIVLGEKAFGGGWVVVGGMTPTDFHNPQPEGTTLRNNILSYTNGKANRVPEPGTLALLLTGVAPAILVNRRRKAA